MNHKELALRELARCADVLLAEGYEVPVFELRWDLRGLVAGQAGIRKGLAFIRLNEPVAQAEGEAFVQTVAHEFAHLVVFARKVRFHRVHGRVPTGPHWSAHGVVWQQTMLLFGREARRCHQYKSAQRVVGRRFFSYRCRCRDDVAVGIIRHRKMLCGVQYRCGRCYAPLVPNVECNAEAAR